MDALGPRIKQLRQKANLNKAALARLVGVSDVTISYWESGAIKQIGHERLVALADALGCPLSELLDNRPQPSPNVLQLTTNPPVPWHTATKDSITLPLEQLFSLIGLEKDCYLVTPGPDQQFDFLKRGDLAVVSPATAFQSNGLYIIEYRDRIQIRHLQRDSTGELHMTSESKADNNAIAADASLRLHGKVEARWSLQ